MRGVRGRSLQEGPSPDKRIETGIRVRNRGRLKRIVVTHKTSTTDPLKGPVLPSWSLSLQVLSSQPPCNALREEEGRTRSKGLRSNPYRHV